MSERTDCVATLEDLRHLEERIADLERTVHRLLEIAGMLK